MSNEQAATEWLAERAIYYVENFTMNSVVALRMALRDLLAATIGATGHDFIRPALHKMLDEIPPNLRTVRMRNRSYPKAIEIG